MLTLRMLGPLMFIFLLCDADSLCPTEFNPLILDPPEVIGEYGGSVLVNCTSTVEDHNGMYWSQTGKTDSAMEDENIFIIESVSLTNWNVTAECKIKLNDNRECSKGLEITVYKNPDMVVMFPTKHVNAAVEGTTYELQCDILSVAPVQNLTVRWYKDNQPILTDTFTNSTKTPEDVSSTLTVNVSRGENGAQFRCEAQLDFGPHGPQPPVSLSDIHHVSVHYAPEFKNRMDVDHVSVNEGNNVTLNCEAEGNPPPTFHWTYDGVNMGNTNNLSITRLNTSATYNCTATNYLGSVTKQIHVHVIKTTKTTAPAAMTTPEASIQKDADSICPTEFNPLILDPPEVIGEYGGSVLVNCTSIVEDHNGMYWRLTGKPDSVMEDENNVISKSVSLTNWNVTAECKIKLNDNRECSKGLEITVYKNPDMVVMFPTKHVNAAVEGTTYELQCDILSVAPVQNLTVRWYKDNQPILTDTFTNSTKTPEDVSSTLTVNVSRGENGAQFRCEAQLDFGPHGPQPPVSLSDIHHVSVHYAPEFKNGMDVDHVSVNEGNNVTLNCEAEGNPPPTFHWTYDGVNMGNTNNLSITRLNTSATYNCTATNYLGSVTKQIHVHVIKTTALEVSTPTGCPLILTPHEIVVRFGDPASVNCSTSVTDALGMGWEAAFGGTGFEAPPSVTWTVTKLKEWTIEPQCYITLEDGFQCHVTPAITLYKTPDTVSLSALDDGPMLEGKEYLLKCDIINVAPVQKLKVKWYRGNEIVHTQACNGTSVFPVSESSTLSVTPERHYNRELFRCEAELDLGPKGPVLVPTVTSSPYMALVHYKPLIQACPGLYTGVENKFSLGMLPCQADGNPTPTVQWYYQGEPVSVSEPFNRTHSGKYTAEFENSLGRINTSVDITIEYSPSFTCNDRYEVKEGGELQTKCEPKGIPEPKVTWFKDGEEKATPHRWTKHDSGKYLLKAINQHGTASHTLYLDVLYAPVFKKGNYSQEVTPGENVTFDCHAEGNPPPVFRWKYPSAVNVRETTGGRQKNTSVTEATSTNAGVYICVATNKVGNVTRSVTLMMKGKTTAFPIWWLLVIVLIVVIFILMIIFHNRWKKHGRYTFVSDQANDGSDLPMNTRSNGVQT